MRRPHPTDTPQARKRAGRPPPTARVRAARARGARRHRISIYSDRLDFHALKAEEFKPGSKMRAHHYREAEKAREKLRLIDH